MSVVPRFPWPCHAQGNRYNDYAQWNGENDFGAGKTHEAEITTGSEVRVVGKELVKLVPALVEEADATNTVETRDNGDN